MDLLHQLDAWAYALIRAVWTLYWPLLAFLIPLIVLERRYPLVPGQPLRPALFNLSWHALVLTIVITLSWGAWGTFVDWLSGAVNLPTARLGEPTGALDEAARVTVGFLLYDFLAYWTHRLQHAVPAMWALHQFHHDERHFNSTTSLRAHWLNAMYVQLLVTVPMFWLLGFNASSPTAYLLYNCFTALSHLNMRVDLGPFSKVIVGPQYHRLHHSSERRLQDSNYATILPLWDILFGTWQAPVRDVPIVTGVAGIPASDAYGRSFLQPFVDWWRMLRGNAADA